MLRSIGLISTLLLPLALVFSGPALTQTTTPQQEPAWKAFATKVAEQVGQMRASHAQRWQAAGGDTTVPARMSSNVAWMTQRLAGMQAVTAALTDLYAVLTPEQRTIADQSFVAMGPRGYGRGPGPQVR